MNRQDQCEIKDFPFIVKVVFALEGRYKTSLAAEHYKKAILGVDVDFIASEVGTVEFNFTVRCGETGDVLAVDVIPTEKPSKTIPTMIGFEKPKKLEGNYVVKDSTCKNGMKGKLITLGAAASHRSVSPITVEKEVGVLKFSKGFGEDDEVEAGYIATWEICCCCHEGRSDYSFTLFNGPYYKGGEQVDFDYSMKIKVKAEPQAKQC